MFTEERWTPEEIAGRLDGEVSVERLTIIDKLEAYRKAAAEKANT